MARILVTSCHKVVNAFQVFCPRETEILSSKPTPTSPGMTLYTLVLPAPLCPAAWPSLHSAKVWGPSQHSVVRRLSLHEHRSPLPLPDVHAALFCSLDSHWPCLGPLWLSPSAMPGSSQSFLPFLTRCHSQSHTCHRCTASVPGSL